jgi:aspartyl-tRNA(Asn)/glutamyl-tRNA(Gln) amidotransferase subunit A
MSDQIVAQSSAAELGQLVQRRALSSVELTTWCLEALETRGRALNAVAELTPELALAQATRADTEIAAGLIRSPLHGVPYGAKDLFATAGIPTRWGSPTYRDQVFDYDATVIERLREAGAVLVAKLAMVELAWGGGYSDPGASLHGPCRNPWNPERWAGGSSSGSGAAVGGRLVPFALGTETWGSITVPSAFCNVSGLRPTYGRVPRYGAMALSWTMDKIGPMARSAEDCALVLQAIAGHDPRDPASASGTFAVQPGALDGRPLRLGILVHDYEARHAPEAKARFTAALEVFHALGHASDEAALPDFPYGVAAQTIVMVEGSSAFENLTHSPRWEELVDPVLQVDLLAGLAIPGVDYLRAMRVRTLAAREAVRVFERFDALIAPTLLQVAPPIDMSLMSLKESRRDAGGNGGFGNLLGWPSISIPMGLGRDDLPLGLEIIAAPYQEATVLALATAFQGATEWHRLYPDV